MSGQHLAITGPFLWWQILFLIAILVSVLCGFLALWRRFIKAGMPGRNISKRRWFVRASFFSIAIVCLGISLRHPEMGQHEETIIRQGLDIMVLVDVSRSMLAEDVSPNRLEAAKRKVIDLTSVLRGERLSLVPFSGTAFVQCPLTSDYDALKLFLDLLTTDLLPRGGSHLGDALAVALKSIKDTPDEKRRGSAILIFSDGEDLSGSGVDQVTEEAKKAGIRIFSIGIGSESGAPIPIESGGFQKDSTDRMVVTKRDSSALLAMAHKTGGAYWPMDIGDKDINAFRDAVGKDANLSSSEERKMVGQPVFQYFVMIAFLCLLAEGSMLIFPLLSRDAKRALALFVVLCSFCLSHSAESATLDAQKAFEANDFEKSETLYREAAKASQGEDAAQAQYNAGVAALKSGHLEAAESAFEAAAETSDKKLKSQAWYNKGVAAAKRGRADAAAEAFKQALSFDPDDREAKENFDALKKQQEKQEQKDGDKSQKSQADNKDKKDSKEGDKKEQDAANQDKQQSTDDKDKKQEKNQSSSQGKEGDQKEEKKAAEKGEAAKKDEQQEKSSAGGEKNDKSMTEEERQAAAEASKEAKSKSLRNQQIDRILEGIPDRGQPQWYAPSEQDQKGRQTNDVDKDW